MFSFTNTTSGTFNSSYWDFGDGITTTNTNTTKSYTAIGTYTVKLVVTNASGCADSISQNITVADKPVPSFTVNGNTSCSTNLYITINNTSTGVGNNYYWDFGDGTNSNAVKPK